MSILARIRIPIPPHLQVPVLIGLTGVLTFLSLCLVAILLHTIVTRKKAMFGPNSRVILTGTELFKDLLSTGFMTIACIGLTIFCTVVLSGVEKNDPKTKEQKFREKFGNQAPGLSMPGMPMPQLGDEEEDD